MFLSRLRRLAEDPVFFLIGWHYSERGGWPKRTWDRPRGDQFPSTKAHALGELTSVEYMSFCYDMALEGLNRVWMDGRMDGWTGRGMDGPMYIVAFDDIYIYIHRYMYYTYTHTCIHT